MHLCACAVLTGFCSRPQAKQAVTGRLQLRCSAQVAVVCPEDGSGVDPCRSRSPISASPTPCPQLTAAKGPPMPGFLEWNCFPTMGVIYPCDLNHSSPCNRASRRSTRPTLRSSSGGNPSILVPPANLGSSQRQLTLKTCRFNRSKEKEWCRWRRSNRSRA